MKKYPVGLDYKYAAQARMHKECGGDLKKFMRQCEASLKKIERELGFKFKRSAPADWTAPKINWPDTI